MTDDDATAAEQAKLIPAKSLNRLSIVHLLLWISMTSVALVCEQRQALKSPFEDAGYAEPLLSELHTKWRLNRALRLFVTPAYGAALAGAAVALWGVIRRRPLFPTQPGHWLLIVVAAQYIPTIVGWIAFDLSKWVWWDTLLAIAMFAIPASTAIMAAFNSAYPRWRASFALLSLGYGTCGLGIAIVYALRNFAVIPGMSLFTLVPAVILCAGYLIAMTSSILDCTSKSRFDLFHWLGCVVFWAVFVESTASWLVWEWN